jgi:hypothetical protein
MLCACAIIINGPECYCGVSHSRKQQNKAKQQPNQHLAKIQATAISIYRLPAPGTERNRPKSVGLDKLAMVMAD